MYVAEQFQFQSHWDKNAWLFNFDNSVLIKL